jgi:DHA3 family macrolide efflux protein-like MFS transporter
MSDGRWARRFFTMWTGQAFSLVGSALAQWALMFWLAISTGSPVVLAIAGVMGLLPQVFLAPIAGAYVDRWDRRKVMIAADLLTALSTLLLMILLAAGVTALIPVFAIMFFRSAMQAFHWPAMQASTALMVPQEQLVRINGLNQAVLGLSTIVGPALGALLYVAMPLPYVLAVDVVTAAIAIGALLAIRIPEIRRSGAVEGTILADMAESFRYLRSWKGVLLIIGIFSVVNFLIVPAITLFNLLSIQHFGQGAYGVALVDIMAGIGLIAGGVALGIWGGAKRQITTAMAAMIIAGAGVLLIGFLPSDGFMLAVAATLLVALALAMVNGSVMAILQKGVRVDLQGRVFALVGSIASGMSPLGLAIAGPVCAAFGIQAWFIAGGLFMMVIGAAAFFVPTLMGIEDRKEVAGPEVDQA